MDIELISKLLKTRGGAELLKYFQEEIDDLIKEENTRLEEILKKPNPPTEELVALKVIVRARDKVKKILERAIGVKDYKKKPKEEADENFGL